MRDVILDANVMGAIAAASDESRASALAALRVVRKKGGRLVVTPTILGELAATYTHEATFEKVLAALQQTCDGYLRASMEQILKIEAAADEPYPIITGRQAQLGSFDGGRGTVQEEEVRATTFGATARLWLESLVARYRRGGRAESPSRRMRRATRLREIRQRST